MLSPLHGRRKFTAFVYTLFVYSAVIICALIIGSGEPVNLSSFAFQLASAYAILSGLFFGSNVLEHFAGTEKLESMKIKKMISDDTGK